MARLSVLFGASLSLVVPALALADEFNITAAEHAACDSDAIRLCASAYPSVERMVSCMVDNRGQLTPVCLKTFDAGLRARHIRIPNLSVSRPKRQAVASDPAG